MDEREQQRRIRHRLSVLRHAEEISGNVAATCRYYGISRPTFYKWLRQYEEFGEDGLRDRSSRPRICPHQTDAEIVSKIVYLRQHYHFGPAKISMYLARYHEVTVSRSGVWRILKRLDMNRLPSSQRHRRYDRRWKRYEKQPPGHRVQVDVKFIEPLHCSVGAGRRTKRFYQFTAIDDCTRIRVLRIYERNTQNSAIQFIDYVLAKLPFAVEVVQTDNGSEFQGSFPLAPARPRDRPHLHQAQDSTAQRESRTLPPDRRHTPPAASIKMSSTSGRGRSESHDHYLRHPPASTRQQAPPVAVASTGEHGANSRR